ncbi:hypothetical protein K1719_044893 [Acacia pycnantha]|nr:hypothetical protein K1719_044893 [Acacia pycnantha]
MKLDPPPRPPSCGVRIHCLHVNISVARSGCIVELETSDLTCPIFFISCGAQHTTNFHVLVGLFHFFSLCFSMKVKNSEGSKGVETVDITVYEYFAKHCGIELTSAYLACLDMGNPKRPVYLPMEVFKFYA